CLRQVDAASLHSIAPMRRQLMNETAVQKMRLIILLVSILALTFAPLSHAEEKAEPPKEKAETPLQDKLMIRGGWAYVFGAAAQVAVGGPVLGVGTSVDFTQTLGGRTSTDALRIDSLYRFNERHAIGFSWYRVGLGGNKALTQQIDVGDNIIS